MDVVEILRVDPFVFGVVDFEVAVRGNTTREEKTTVSQDEDNR